MRSKRILKAQPKRTLREISGWIGYTPARMSQIMNLLFLSPVIQEEVLFSSKSSIHQLTINIAHKISQELSWDKQYELWLQSRDKEILVEIILDAVNNLSVRFVFLRLVQTSIVGLTL